VLLDDKIGKPKFKFGQHCNFSVKEEKNGRHAQWGSHLEIVQAPQRTCRHSQSTVMGAHSNRRQIWMLN